jgi:lipoprotein-releasing system ATP-binding protein
MIISARDIHKSFGTLEVLKGVDVEVAAGEVLAVTGPSGAGKTTLLQILGTLSAPDSGLLEIDGTTVFDGTRRQLRGDSLAAFRGRRIGFVFQDHHLLPEFTARENVMIPALIAGRPSQEAAREAERLLTLTGLQARQEHKPSELSGGEKQRVAIARALVNNPAVVFADEPTGNLDSVTKQEIHNLFFNLRDTLSQTFVIVTHDPSLAALCDRCLHMTDGRFE